MGVAVKFLVLSILSFSMVTGFTLFRRQSVRWQTLTQLDIRDAGVDLPCHEEGFFQHPTNCSRFYRCVDFVGTGQHYSKYLYECPKKLIFVESIETCIKAKCPGKSTPSTPVTSPSSSSPTTLSTSMATTTPIPTTLITSSSPPNNELTTVTENVIEKETTPVGITEQTTLQTTSNEYLNLLDEKDKLKDVNETLSEVGELLEETQDILQNLGDLLAGLRKAIFTWRENYATKIDTLKQCLIQLKELSKNTVDKNLDEIDLLTGRIKVLLVEIKELTNQIKENKINISSNLQNSVSSAINQTKETSAAVEQQKQQTVEKIEKIDEYISMEFETTLVPESSTTPQTESYTTEESTTENSYVTETPSQTDITDIATSNVDTVTPDSTIQTTKPDIHIQETQSTTDEPMVSGTNIETTEFTETTMMTDIESTTLDSMTTETDGETESFETTMVNETQSTDIKDSTTEASPVSTDQPSETTVFVPKPWEAHKCQEVYSFKPPLTPEYSLRFCRGQLLGDRTRCNVFYQCSDLRTPYICTEGRIFNQKTQSCQIKTATMCHNKELVLPSYHCGQVKEIYNPNNRRTPRIGPVPYSVRAKVDY